MNPTSAVSVAEFLPLAGAVGLGLVCAGGGLLAAQRAKAGAIGEAVPRIAVRVLGLAGLAFGLAGLTGLTTGISPLAMMGSLFVGFVATASADWSTARAGVAGSGTVGTVVAGTIAAAERRRAA